MNALMLLPPTIAAHEILDVDILAVSLKLLWMVGCLVLVYTFRHFSLPLELLRDKDACKKRI